MTVVGVAVGFGDGATEAVYVVGANEGSAVDGDGVGFSVGLHDGCVDG